ncbi:hypothetical protein P8452_74577 [Trifolium repens]|nr:hypothetical protein P8452_74577 [Trifolium repens]
MQSPSRLIGPKAFRYSIFISFRGSYGQALDVHKNRVTPETLEKWTNALTSVADFRGCHMERARGIYEFQYIYDIIQDTWLERIYHLRIQLFEHDKRTNQSCLK